jgi:biopolymer transport protein ExbB
MLNAMFTNPFLWPVALCALIGLAIAIERAVYLFFRASVAPEPFMAAIQKHVLAGDVDRALNHCNAEPSAPLPRVVRAALLAVGSSREDMVMAVDQAMLDVTPMVQRRVAYLATIANVVTLFGLLGTIVGLITSFNAVTHAQIEEKQTMLAGGIAIAMYTTAGGIAVAIPTLVVYSILVQRGNAILDDAERLGLKTVMLLQAMRNKAGEAAVAP